MLAITAEGVAPCTFEPGTDNLVLLAEPTSPTIALVNQHRLESHKEARTALRDLLGAFVLSFPRQPGEDLRFVDGFSVVTVVPKIGAAMHLMQYRLNQQFCDFCDHRLADLCLSVTAAIMGRNEPDINHLQHEARSAWAYLNETESLNGTEAIEDASLAGDVHPLIETVTTRIAYMLLVSTLPEGPEAPF